MNETTHDRPPLVVLDGSGGPPSTALRLAWARSDFLERLGTIGGPVVWFGTGCGELLPSLHDPAELNQALQSGGHDSFLVVDPSQVFLDPEVVLGGLACFDPSRQSSFSQWEHCRLPVGIGVRAISSRSWLELGCDSLESFFADLREHCAAHRFAYDARALVSFDQSLLDARFGPALERALSECSPRSWNLNGFLELAASRAASLRYRPIPDGSRFDERGMPAPYGFESLECAEFPTYVMFDITNLCNARCVHCPQSLRDEDGRLPAFLKHKDHQTLESFQRVIDECAEHDVHFVRITADGEPLVHPQLFEMLAYASERGVGPVGLTTNGSLLNAERAERLLDSGVAMVDFSLDAATKETFEAIRVGLSFDRTIANVHRFLELRRARGADVKVVVSFVHQEANHGELDAFRSFWEPLVDEVIVREMTSNVGLNDPTESRFPGWDARWPCAHYFRRVVVNHRGIVKTCPIDWEQKTALESVETASIFDQWHGPAYWAQRMAHLNDAFPADSICGSCRDWSGTPWTLGYEKVVERLVPAA
ncbi:MAG TPA: radical SAM/SPASM domain-containing protein [Planctomycetes bacterium]|nr:radical SAM/SPASM domain-containing protein [Planctomycetota bacterium]